jgi:hypothetical protein
MDYRARAMLTAWVLRELFRFIFLRPKTSRTAYSARRYVTTPTSTLDMPTALCLRLAAGFDAITEIGAASGGRIIEVKKLIPTIHATAMDIGADYQSPRLLEGVEFVRYEAAKLRPGSFVFCVGTLSCMNEKELDELFSAIAAGGCTLLAIEPQPPYVISSVMRRSDASWYHPYGMIAARHRLLDINEHQDSGWRHSDSLKNFERWPPMLFGRRGP